MITFLYGDDALSISNFINAKIKKYKHEDIFRFEKKDTKPRDVLEIINSGGLFSTKKLIIIKASSINNIKFKEKDLELFEKDTLQEIIIDASRLSQTAKIVKSLQGKAKIIKYSKKIDYSNFDIADSLIILNNPKRALSIFNNSPDVDAIIYGLIGTIAYDLRGVISVRANNKLSKTFKPFVKNKFLKSKLTDSEIKSLYTELLSLEADCKNYKRKITTKELFIDFVLKNFLK